MACRALGEAARENTGCSSAAQLRLVLKSICCLSAVPMELGICIFSHSNLTSPPWETISASIFLISRVRPGPGPEFPAGFLSPVFCSCSPSPLSPHREHQIPRHYPSRWGVGPQQYPARSSVPDEQVGWLNVEPEGDPPGETCMILQRAFVDTERMPVVRLGERVNSHGIGDGQVGGVSTLGAQGILAAAVTADSCIHLYPGICQGPERRGLRFAACFPGL